VDWKIRNGRLKFLSGKKFPLILGVEVSGTVVEVGSSVSAFRKGDRVYAGLSHRGGGYAEKVTAKAERAIQIPDELPFREASTLAVAGVTAYQCLSMHYPVKKGDHILINNGSGGVGTFAIQIAKILGARVTAVCSERNAGLVRSLGADTVIDYNKEDFRNHTETYDLILDAAANATFRNSKNCLKKGGMLIKLNLEWSSVRDMLFTRLFSYKKLKVILVKNRKEDLLWLINQIITGAVNVVIDREFSLFEARAAQEYSESGRARGKIIIGNSVSAT